MSVWFIVLSGSKHLMSSLQVSGVIFNMLDNKIKDKVSSNTYFPTVLTIVHVIMNFMAFLQAFICHLHQKNYQVVQ